MSATQVLVTVAAGAARARPLGAVEREAVPPRRRGLAPIAALRPEDEHEHEHEEHEHEDEDGDEDGARPSGAAARQPRGRAAHCRIALQYLD
ncbi:hypothetical protein [Kitasatospora sp. NPDC050463]|uniref:hypothetical protein n=1 Tax=Kitasatospora sp. NPDC050463 TaxID=3155786 RepID=UPI0033D320EC